MIFNFNNTNILTEKLFDIEKYTEYQIELIRTFCQEGPQFFKIISQEKLPELIKKTISEYYKPEDVNETAIIRSVMWLMDMLIKQMKTKNEEEIINFRQNVMDVLCDHAKIFDNDPIVNEDPYYKTIIIPKQTIGNHSLEYQSYKPYEVFPYDMGINYLDLSIPQVGFFTKEFKYPAITKDKKQEWMTITPNEIYTMRKHIQDAHGKVLTLGLGMGYYAFMVSEKSSVESVTVIESSQEIIDLFNEYILPQFPNKQKITIINGDAFDYMENLEDGKYDICFADIWDGVFDNIPYLKLKSICNRFSLTQISYWIEEGFLQNIKSKISRQICLEGYNYLRLLPQIEYENLNDKYVETMLKQEIISTPENIDRLLKTDIIKQLIGKVDYQKINTA